MFNEKLLPFSLLRTTNFACLHLNGGDSAFNVSLPPDKENYTEVLQSASLEDRNCTVQEKTTTQIVMTLFQAAFSVYPFYCTFSRNDLFVMIVPGSAQQHYFTCTCIRLLYFFHSLFELLKDHNVVSINTLTFVRIAVRTTKPKYSG